MEHAALNEPFDLEADAGVDQLVEVAAGVLEGERVRVDEVLGNKVVNLGR